MTKTYNIKNFIDIILLISAFLSFISILILYGFYIDIKTDIFILKLQHFLSLVFIIGLAINFFNAKSKVYFFKKYPFQIILTSVFLLTAIIQTVHIIQTPQIFELTRKTFFKEDLFILILHIFLVISSFVAITKFRDIWLIFPLRASRILVLSFFFVILTGTVLLKLPKASTNLSWIDALFTATSAVCVTGLSPIDVTKVLTFEGQVILMGLIQIGGLGIITFTTFVAIFLQKGFRLKDQVLLKEIMDDDELNSISSMLIRIVGITFTIEALGTVFLYFSWKNFGFDEFDRIFYSLFHSVSAYCNAGYSNYSVGMESPVFSGHAPTLIIMMILIVSGGLGFYTFNFLLFQRKKCKHQGSKLQTKIILITTLILIFGGALLVWLLQYQEWKNLPLKNQILNSFFMSITSRTAGFANINIQQVLVPTSLVIIFLMYIGAAPNSTAGGIKITTFVTLLFGVWAFIRGKDRVEIGWNTINMVVVRRSLVVFFISITLISIAILLLSITENYYALGGRKMDIFDLFFETVSAFGTVGLSKGITPFLSSFGKLVIIFMMFFGRVGLFTMAIAIGEEKIHAKYKYPETNIMVG